MIDATGESLFFYEQRTPARRYKRVRKEPEELPQALRYFKYANLNPRIAAFLGKQDPKNLVKRAKGAGGQDEKDQANADSKPSAADTTTTDSLGFLGGFGEGLSQEARSLLPEIGQGGMGLVKMAAIDESVGASRLSFNDVDDPQRYQFEETTFAAPNILRELSEALTRFNKSFTDYVKRSQISGQTEEDVKHQPAEVLPNPLKNMLSQEWFDLISETVYTPRVWQSQAYKSGYKYASTLASAGRQMTATTALERDSAAKGDLKGMVDLLDVKPTKLMGVDEMPNIHKRKGKVGEKDAKVHSKTDDRQIRHISNPTITFNLSSKRAIDEGWLVNAPVDRDFKESDFLEWATSRLQALMKQKENEDEYARKTGCNKPTVIRHYGDSRRDTLMKLYRKSNESEAKQNRKASTVPKIPQLSKLDNAERDRFMVQLPDGSTTLFYPGGNVAVMASAVPNSPGELYVNCFDNDLARSCLAAFTPYGKSCCYHKNGVPALVLSEAGGVLKSEDGSVTRKWKWPKYGKMKENVVFHLNKEMYVRVSSKQSVTLHFSCSRETHKINVGAVPGAQTPSSLAADSQGYLQAGLKYSSKSALEHSGSQRTSKDDRARHNRMRRNFFGMRKQSKKYSEVEELKKSLDTPDRFEYESQADRELQRLQHKSRLLVDDWMEHYRIAVGISSPALKKLLDKSTVKNADRNVRSATERKAPSALDEATEDITRGSTKFQSFRSPSAPPKHMIVRTNATTSGASTDAAQSNSDDVEKKSSGNESVHVRIDEIAKELRTPSTGKRVPIRQFKSASTMESHSKGGRSQKILRSSMHTSMGTHQPSTQTPQEKFWSPSVTACPVVTRLNLLNPDSTKNFTCKCSKHHVPFIKDIEFDTFMRDVVPQTQLVVVSVINSIYESSNPYSTMLESIYISKNRNRTKPCLQCRHDQYRILCYDLAKAHSGTDRQKPLQFERHCVVPGMTLMYCGGKLLFADHIFNGYGNARKDFRKQIFKCRQDYHMGHYLPDDFRFSPSRGKSGPRAAWGGEIGGAGVCGKGKPGLLPGRLSVPLSTVSGAPRPTHPAYQRLTKSASQSSSSQSDLSSNDGPLKSTSRTKFDSARDFVQFSLSTKVYVHPMHRAHNRNASMAPKTSLLPRGESSAAQLNHFLMMQTVK